VKNLLVTGGSGFIGSNFIRYMFRKYPDYRIVNLDLLTYAGNLHNLDDISREPNYIFIHGNITDRALVKSLVGNYGIEMIVNFAAESHVDRSITHPNIFIETNVQGTGVLLDVARTMKVKKYLQISTDEVYGTLGEEGYFNELTPLTPNSPYSASKASADLLVRAYHKTYGLNVNITRCTNNYGPYQFPEKLIPLLISNGIDGKKLPIYGNGTNIRDWLHVHDHCRAIDLVLHQGRSGEIYNIGGHSERTNKEIAQFIIEQMCLKNDSIEYVTDRLGHDYRYAVDPSKIETELGWKPEYTFDRGMVETIAWYLDNEKWWRPLKN